MPPTDDQIDQVAKLTMGQDRNIYWHVYREGRLTASHFGKVLHQIRINSYPPSLFKTLLGEYHPEVSESVQFGNVNEDSAVRQWENATGQRSQECGLYLHKSGVLGATPDRLVGDNELIEVKCLYSLDKKNSPTGIIDAIGTIKGFPLVRTNGRVDLDWNHNYYHQIQGQLHMTNRRKCTVILWTTMQMVSVQVTRSEEWGQENIPKLLTFYKERLLPHIIERGV